MNIHKLLFPKKYREISNLEKQIKLLELEVAAFESYETEKPTMADLMKDNLKLTTLKLDEPNAPDYLGEGEDEKRGRLARGEDIWQNETFHEIFRYLMNKQGNYTLKEATNDAEIFAGRLSMYGLVLFKGEVERCHSLFAEETAPKDFDRNEVI